MRRDQEEAFEEFVRRHGDALLRSAFLLVGDRGHAEDLVQTALERTAQKWPDLTGAPLPYARAIVANLSTDRWRSLQARPPERLVGEHAADVAWVQPAQNELRSGIVEGLRTLAPLQRAVLVLRYFDDLSELETAEALGVSVGTVKNTAFKAKARLREALGSLDEEGAR